jgi:hypothetical protein
MKSYNFFVTAAKLTGILLFPLLFSCSKSDSSTSDTPLTPPPPPPTTEELFYGGNNLDAPTLTAGRYEAAARFTKEKIGVRVGKAIKEIRFFTTGMPDSVKVKLYGPSTSTAPGDLLYSADVTGVLVASSWNIHKLTKAITLKNEDIWLSIEFKLSNGQRSIGCDPGPALMDGDWLYSSMDSLWTPFNKRPNGANINWNIRLGVEL